MLTIENQKAGDASVMGIPVASIQRSALVQAWGAAGLALIAGYVDSYSVLNFGVYASFMSGNTTSAGLRLGQINVAAAAHSLLPIPFFVLGTFMGTLILPADRRAGLARLSVLVAALLIMDIVAAYFAWSAWVGILLLSSAMGIMNTSITHVGAQSVSLGFVTGDLNNLGQRLASGAKRAPVRNMQGPWDTHWMRAAQLAGIWAAFFTGAVLGAALAIRLANWTLMLPAFMLVIYALLDNRPTV
jgi:uncharacterized membrane protein YoaK (UPF0700 family)